MLRTTFSRGGRLQSYLTADGRRGYPAADGQRGRRYGLASIKKASVEYYWRTQIRRGEGKPRKKLQHDYHTHALSSSIEYCFFFVGFAAQFAGCSNGGSPSPIKENFCTGSHANYSTRCLFRSDTKALHVLSVIFVSLHLNSGV
jgi:hypothetical protein